MGLRDKLKRLEREVQEEMIEILQRDGTVERFPQALAAEAFLALCQGQEHPLLEAARASSDPPWSEGVYSTDPASMRDVEYLSE